MRWSATFLHTLRDVPADAEVPSHRWLAKAGFLTKVASGIYVYAPAMWRVMRKVEAIVREEMDAAGGQELLMPAAQPKALWEKSGRWERYVADGILFTLADRKGAEMCLGPTHEEVVTDLADRQITSYRQLPVNLYQIQTKFRDEIRPRFGLMRGREFIMKDAYSFDADEAGLQVSYDAMVAAYHRIFERCGLDFTVVDADSGAIGGARSQEFMVNAETGEDAILMCGECSYGANVERATGRIEQGPMIDGDAPPMERVDTPGVKTVAGLAECLDLPETRLVKTVLYTANFTDRDEVVAVMIRGDLDVNETKLVNHLGALAVAVADEKTVVEATGAEPGFAGPIGLADHVRLVSDDSVEPMTSFECGGCETDVHLINVVFGRDLDVPEFSNLATARAGDGCPRCEGTLAEARGIEVGHVFQLGTKYSEAMGATFAGDDGHQAPFVMGCYGLGVSRVAAAAVEQHHDDNGMCWPTALAPWEAVVIPVSGKDEAQQEAAARIHDELEAAGIEVMLDDRDMGAGAKFKDAELVGFPWRIVCGRGVADGTAEVQARTSDTAEDAALGDVVAKITEAVEAGRASGA